MTENAHGKTRYIPRIIGRTNHSFDCKLQNCKILVSGAEELFPDNKETGCMADDTFNIVPGPNIPPTNKDTTKAQYNYHQLEEATNIIKEQKAVKSDDTAVPEYLGEKHLLNKTQNGVGRGADSERRVQS
jgi:hypothetical protein